MDYHPYHELHPHRHGWSSTNPPPMSLTPDTSGWYSAQPVPIIPFSPVNQPPPPHPQNYSEPISPSLEKIDQIKIHDFWQGRLAPFPGFSSRPGLFSFKKNQSVLINSPASTGELPKLQLLPPRSMISSTSINISPTNTPSTELKAEENNVSPLYLPLPLSHGRAKSRIFNSINM